MSADDKLEDHAKDAVEYFAEQLEENKDADEHDSHVKVRGHSRSYAFQPKSAGKSGFHSRFALKVSAGSTHSPKSRFPHCFTFVQILIFPVLL